MYKIPDYTGQAMGAYSNAAGTAAGMTKDIKPYVPGKTVGGGMMTAMGGGLAGAQLGTMISTGAMAGPVGAGIGAGVGLLSYILS